MELDRFKENLLSKFNGVAGKPPPPFGSWWSAAFFVGAGTISIYAFSQSPREFTAKLIRGLPLGASGAGMAYLAEVFKVSGEADPIISRAKSVWTHTDEPWKVRGVYLALFVVSIYAIGEYPPEAAKITGWATGYLSCDFLVDSLIKEAKNRISPKN